MRSTLRSQVLTPTVIPSSAHTERIPLPRWLSPVLPKIPWQAAGLRSARITFPMSLAPGESKTFVFVLAYIENPIDQKWVWTPRGRRDQPRTGRSPLMALRHHREGGCRTCRIKGILGRTALPLHHLFLRGEARPHGERMAPVSVYGYLQHEPFRFLF